MTLYNIQLRTDRLVEQTYVVESDNLDALRILTARFVGDLLRDHTAEIWEDQDWQIDVADEDGLILFVMTISASQTAATMNIGQ